VRHVRNVLEAHGDQYTRSDGNGVLQNSRRHHQSSAWGSNNLYKVLDFGHMDLTKKLYRSNTDKMLTGVCGGIAEYLVMDSTVLRLIWALIVCFTGFIPGVLVYIVAAIIMPLKPEPTAPTVPAA
jgi:phage shock protein C